MSYRATQADRPCPAAPDEYGSAQPASCTLRQESGCAESLHWEAAHQSKDRKQERCDEVQQDACGGHISRWALPAYERCSGANAAPHAHTSVGGLPGKCSGIFLVHRRRSEEHTSDLQALMRI